MTAFLRTAKAFAAAFETATRPEGGSFVRLRPGSPGWMRDAIRDAHDGGSILPDDWLYALSQRCADAIAEAEAEDADAAREAIGAIEPDIYTADLARWLAVSVRHVELCDEAMAEWGDLPRDNPTVALIQRGQLLQIQRVGAALVDAIAAAAADEAEDGGDDE